MIDAPEDEATVPYQYVLANLLADAPEAVAVLFLDDSGETVELACVEGDPFDLKVSGAYLGIYLRRIRTILEETESGELRDFHIELDQLQYQVAPLPDGYSLILVQRRPARVAMGRRLLIAAAEQLRREVF